MELSTLHNTLKQEGTSQSARYMAALNPDYIQIDETTMLDQLRFAEEYSHFLVYLNASGSNDHVEKQTWKDFFTHDSTTLVAKIANHDVTKIRLHYSGLFATFSNNPLLYSFLNLIRYTGIWVGQLDAWLKGAMPSSLLHQDLSLVIQAELSPKLIKLKEYYLATKSFGPQEQSFEDIFNLNSLEPVWGSLHKITAADQTVFVGNTEEEKLKNAAVYVTAIFESFMKLVSRTVLRGNIYLQDSLGKEGNHAPHMALFLSFLQIFRHGQQEFNKLGQRYIEFYYKKFLQIQLRCPLPDATVVLFTLTKGMPDYQLPRATALIAGKDAAAKQQTYLTDKELLVTAAQIKSLKTLFIDYAGDSIKGVYAAPVANSADGKGAPLAAGQTWDTFGHVDQALVAETGFAIASPMLRMQEGLRHLTLNFALHSEQGMAQTGPVDLDPRLFTFALTSEKGWLSSLPKTGAPADINIVSIQLDLVNLSGSLLIDLEIPASTQAAVSPYIEGIHGAHYQSSHPVLKVIINYPIDYQPATVNPKLLEPPGQNASDTGGMVSRSTLDNLENSPDELETVNPVVSRTQLNLLQQARITKCIISAAVGLLSLPQSQDQDGADETLVAASDGLAGVNAANDEGDLDTTRSFLPFTAIPKIGSSFYLNAAEFSQKPISKATIWLEWLLPDNFDSYYEPYGILYSENNFRVEIDRLEGQRHVKQGQYDLFTDGQITQQIALGELDAVTLSKQDISSQKPQAGSLRQQDGTLRLSLLQDFGHAIYPQLIVGSLMERSGKLSLSDQDSSGLQKEMDTHPLAFTTQPKTLTQLKNMVNTPGASDEQLHGALSQALKFSLVRHNLEAFAPPASGGTPGEPPKVQATPNAIKYIGASITNFIRTGSFSNPQNAGAGVSQGAVNLPPVNQAIEFVVRKETENHLDYVSRLAASELIADKTKAASEKQLSDTVNRILTEQQGAYMQKLHKGTQDLLKILSIPPPPYTPLLKSLRLAYEASRDFDQDQDRFYHLFPFGAVGQSAFGATGNAAYLLPQYGIPAAADSVVENVEGQLWIGVQGIKAGSQLALFFQLVDGSNLEFGKPPQITWSYLAGDNWKLISDRNLISDSTYSLQNKGILVVDLPGDMLPATQQVQEQDLVWLRASVQQGSVNVPHIVSVLPNAVMATFDDQDNAPAHYALPLKEGSISKMVNKFPEIASLVQPVASWGARASEQGPEYRVRISERLRHKNRAVTNWDYEHMTLQAFTAVYKVKCLNNLYVDRLKPGDKGQFVPGHVSLVLIPDLRNLGINETLPLEPRVPYKTLVDVETYFSAVSIQGVSIHALNANFDVVTVVSAVKFKSGLDYGQQLKTLNIDLIGFLAPWTVNAGADISFQGKVYASSLLDFIDKRTYVDYVARFEMHCSNAEGPIVETSPSSDFSIVASAASHVLTPWNPQS